VSSYTPLGARPGRQPAGRAGGEAVEAGAAAAGNGRGAVVADHAAYRVLPGRDDQVAARRGKVIYNCLPADLYPAGAQPVKGSFEIGWPGEIQGRVFDNWQACGFR
jgi:hypothetical protein